MEEIEGGKELDRRKRDREKPGQKEAGQYPAVASGEWMADVSGAVEGVSERKAGSCEQREGLGSEKLQGKNESEP